MLVTTEVELVTVKQVTVITVRAILLVHFAIFALPDIMVIQLAIFLVFLVIVHFLDIHLLKNVKVSLEMITYALIVKKDTLDQSVTNVTLVTMAIP